MGEETWYDLQFIIWNSALGIRDHVMIDRVEDDGSGVFAWLEAPYDMVGPFCMDDLQRSGRIEFAECVVMSRERWLSEQHALREESYRRQRKVREEMYQALRKRDRARQDGPTKAGTFDETAYRKSLSLPKHGRLGASQIKTAFKKMAKEAHPDAGGSHERFVKITRARDALLASLS